MNSEEAKDVGDALTRAIDDFMSKIGTPEAPLREAAVRELLWDNKIGISHVLRDYAQLTDY